VRSAPMQAAGQHGGAGDGAAVLCDGTPAAFHECVTG
jgi:hypothetical protein